MTTPNKPSSSEIGCTYLLVGSMVAVIIFGVIAGIVHTAETAPGELVFMALVLGLMLYNFLIRKPPSKGIAIFIGVILLIFAIGQC